MTVAGSPVQALCAGARIPVTPEWQKRGAHEILHRHAAGTPEVDDILELKGPVEVNVHAGIRVDVEREGETSRHLMDVSSAGLRESIHSYPNLGASAACCEGRRQDDNATATRRDRSSSMRSSSATGNLPWSLWSNPDG